MTLSIAPALPALVTAALLAVAMVAPVTAQSPTTPSSPDPFGWLEDIHGPRAMAWVAQQNAHAAAVLEADPRYETFRRQALAIFTAPDRIPDPEFLGGAIANFWQDGDHVKGLWRRTTPTSFASARPAWATLVDFDALSATEGRNWIFKGADCLPPEDRLCLLRISDGGGDAVEIREFDTAARSFVPGGFHFTSGKQDISWLDADTLLVGRDWGPGTMTQSGYPYVIKQLRRGQALADAREVYRGKPDDVAAAARVLRDAAGRIAVVIIERHIGFFETEFFTLDQAGATHPLNLPRKSTVEGYLAGRLIVRLNEDWSATPRHPAFEAGALVAVDPVGGGVAPIVQPTARQTIDAVAVTRSRVMVKLLDDVNGIVDVYAPAGDAWSRLRLDLPKGSALDIRAADPASDRAYVAAESFLEPTTLWAVDAATGSVARIKALPPRFDASGDVTEQHFAISTDGTRVPYFLVRPRSMKPDGATPVQMFGYGGFQVSLTSRLPPRTRQIVARARRRLCFGEHPRRRRVRTCLARGGAPRKPPARLRRLRGRGAGPDRPRHHLTAPPRHLWAVQRRRADQRRDHPAP